MITVGPGEAGAGVGTTHGCSTTGAGAGTVLIGVGVGTILILPGVGAGTHGDITAGAGEASVGDILGVAGDMQAIMVGVDIMATGTDLTITIIAEIMPT